MKEDLLKIISNYGTINQLKKLNEECYELIEAIRDYESTDYEPYTDSIEERSISEEEQKEWLKEHIIEEFADVCVMLHQFKEYYDIKPFEIYNVMEQKIKRQLDRMKEKNNEK